MEISGSSIWLLGASSGIGAALAEALSREGARLILSARRKDALEAVKEKLSGEGHAVIPADVTDNESLIAAVSTIKESVQGFDALIYCAGTYSPTPARSFDADAHHHMMSLNYGGLINTLSVVLPEFQEQKRGYIYAISSVVGYRAIPLASAYGASKSAMQYLIHAMREEIKRDGIHMTVINPGFVETPLTEQNEFEMPCLITAEEAARAIVRGMKRDEIEIHFPKKFSLFLKCLGFLPEKLYGALMAKKVFGS